MKNKINVLCVVLLLCFIFTGCTTLLPPTNTNEYETKEPINTNDFSTNTPEPTPEPTPNYTDVSILSVGDIIVHSPQLVAQYNKDEDTYDFSNNFKYVSNYISQADYSVANFETTLAGNEWREYSGYPLFNTPDELAHALKDAGFDMMLTANNHIYDSGDRGFYRTYEVLNNLGFDVLGTRTNVEQKKYTVKDIKGIKIGFINYTYENVKLNGKKNINGNAVSDEVAPLINSFDYNDLNSFYEEVEASINQMNEEAVEFIIAYIHWGNEYKINQNSWQERIAQKLCDLGVNVIIGSHPHVLQPVDVLTSEETGNKTLCFYSLGNFISNQRIKHMDLKTGHTEDGLMLILNIRKNNNGKISLYSVEYVPTWVNLYYDSSKPVYEIVPLPEAVSSVEAFNLDKSIQALDNAKDSYERTKNIINANADKINKYTRFTEAELY